MWDKLIKNQRAMGNRLFRLSAQAALIAALASQSAVAAKGNEKALGDVESGLSTAVSGAASKTSDPTSKHVMIWGKDHFKSGLYTSASGVGDIFNGLRSLGRSAYCASSPLLWLDMIAEGFKGTWTLGKGVFKIPFGLAITAAGGLTGYGGALTYKPIQTLATTAATAGLIATLYYNPQLLYQAGKISLKAVTEAASTAVSAAFYTGGMLCKGSALLMSPFQSASENPSALSLVGRAATGSIDALGAGLIQAGGAVGNYSTILSYIRPLLKP